MKTVRNIWTAFMTTLYAVILSCVVYQWTAQGCGAVSVLAAIFFYTTTCSAVWFVVWNCLKERDE